MELYEINLPSFFQTLYSRRFLVFGFILFFTLGSFLVSEFYFEEMYKTEMWIKPTEDFLANTKSVSVAQLQAYFSYPEVIRVATNLETSQNLALSTNRLSFEEVGESIYISYKHPWNPQATKLLNRWVTATNYKLVMDGSLSLISNLEDRIAFLIKEITMEKEKLDYMNQMIKEEGKYNQIEGFIKSDMEPYILQELNPNYLELKMESNQLQLEIRELESDLIFERDVLESFERVQDGLFKVYARSQINDNDHQLTDQLRMAETKYNMYLQKYQEEYEVTKIDMVPYTIISEPHTTPTPIFPNVKQNVVLAALLGFIVGVMVVFTFECIRQSGMTISISE